MGGKTASAAEVVKTPLPGIRLITVKFEIGGHHAAETPQPLQPFLPVGFVCRIECRPDAGDTDIEAARVMLQERLRALEQRALELCHSS